jgi:putative oxidoreductase
MFRTLIHTTEDSTLAIERMILGVVFFAHGAQKVLGWFGGQGYAATMGQFTHGMGIPPALAVLAIMAEFLGGIGLILGFLSRIAAFGIAVNMLVAVFMVHLRNGLFMNWTGKQPGEGFEYHLLVIAIAAMVMVRGAGAFSVDHAMQTAGPIQPQPYPQVSGG